MTNDLREQIEGVITNEPVTLFMKGTPQFVMCGNSDRALRALRGAGAPVTAVDVLPDPAIRQELSSVSGWPTIPQVFVKGELIGGADIVEELAASGELERKLEAALGTDYRESRSERGVGVRYEDHFFQTSSGWRQRLRPARWRRSPTAAVPGRAAA